MTDTVAAAAASCGEPKSRVDIFKGLVGDLARPFGVIVNGGATAAVSIIGVMHEPTLAPAILTADAVILGIIWAAKSAENYGANREAAKVEIAKATTGTTSP